MSNHFKGPIASKGTNECLRHADQLKMRNGTKATPAPVEHFSIWKYNLNLIKSRVTLHCSEICGGWGQSYLHFTDKHTVPLWTVLHIFSKFTPPLFCYVSSVKCRQARSCLGSRSENFNMNMWWALSKIIHSNRSELGQEPGHPTLPQVPPSPCPWGQEIHQRAHLKIARARDSLQLRFDLWTYL